MATTTNVSFNVPGINRAISASVIGSLGADNLRLVATALAVPFDPTAVDTATLRESVLTAFNTWVGNAQRVLAASGLIPATATVEEADTLPPTGTSPESQPEPSSSGQQGQPPQTASLGEAAGTGGTTPAPIVAPISVATPAPIVQPMASAPITVSPSIAPPMTAAPNSVSPSINAATSTNAHPPSAHLAQPSRKYDGTQDLAPWKAEVEGLRATFGWAPATTSHVMVTNLAGNAATWWQTRDADTQHALRADPTALFAALETKFAPLVHRHLEAQLAELRLVEPSPAAIDAHGMRFEALYRRVHPGTPVREVIRAFAKSLPAHLCEHLLSHHPPPTSLDEALAVVTAKAGAVVDALESSRDKRTALAAAASSAGGQSSLSTPEYYDDSGMLEEATTVAAVGAAPRQPPRPQLRFTSTAQGPSTRDREGQGRQRAVRCYNCNGWGHMSKDCPSPPTNASRARRTPQSEPNTPTRAGSAQGSVGKSNLNQRSKNFQ